MHKTVTLHAHMPFFYPIQYKVLNFTDTKSCEKSNKPVFRNFLVKLNLPCTFVVRNTCSSSFYTIFSMKEKKPCDLSPSQNGVAHLARWIFMNFSLSRSLSCTACSESILTYTRWESLLNTGNLIKDILSAIKNERKIFQPEVFN